MSFLGVIGGACSDDASAPPASADAAGALALEPAGLPVSLTAVWGCGPDAAWAVGPGGTILRFDGRSWWRQPRITDADLAGVHGTSERDVWVVGDDVVLHWDGSSWIEALSGMQETLLGVWQRAPDDVWMAGLTWDTDRGLLRHWDGSDWQWREVPGASTLWEVSGRDDQVWIGGTATSGSAHGFLTRGTGTYFASMDFSGGSLRGIWGSGSDQLWVAPYIGPLQHWDGSRWSSHAVGPEGMRLMGLSGSAANDVWAVGLGGVILHWDGSRWREVESGAEDNLSAVWATAPNDVWAVGSRVLHWDGSRWHRATVR